MASVHKSLFLHPGCGPRGPRARCECEETAWHTWRGIDKKNWTLGSFLRINIYIYISCITYIYIYTVYIYIMNNNSNNHDNSRIYYIYICECLFSSTLTWEVPAVLIRSRSEYGVSSPVPILRTSQGNYAAMIFPKSEPLRRRSVCICIS